MGRIYKQSIYGGLITISGIVMGIAINLLSMHYFPKEEFGFTQNFIRIGSLLAQVGVMGFHMTLLIKGQTYEKDSPERHAFFSYSLIALLLGLSLISLLLFIGSNAFVNLYQESDRVLMRKFFFLIPIYTFISGVILYLETWLQGNYHTARATFSREILIRLFYISLIFAYGFDLINFTSFILAFVSLHALPFLYLLWRGRLTEKIRFNLNFKLLSKETKRHLWSFSIFHFFSIISLMLVHEMDILLLAPMSGLEDVAVYGMAALVVNMMRAPMRTIAAAITPDLSKYYHSNDKESLTKLFNISRVNAQLYGVFMIVIVLINLQHIPFVLTYIRDGYEQVAVLVAILLVGQFFEMMTGFNHELIGISRYYKMNFWLSITTAIMLFVLQFFMIKQWGIYGAAIATSIGFTLFNIVKSWFIYHKFQIPVIRKQGWLSLLIGLGLGLLFYFLPVFFHPLIDVVFRSTLFTLSFWWIAYRVNISAQLNQMTEKIADLIKK